MPNGLKQDLGRLESSLSDRVAFMGGLERFWKLSGRNTIWAVHKTSALVRSR